jgi:PAS domain S-box-containing protein
VIAVVPSSPRILIVEDERIVANDIQQTLTELGYQVSAVASSADEALERARESIPDLVLMDIRIQGPVDGIAAAALLRDRYGVPIVYLTAHADQATIERAKRTEPLGYLMKPVQPAELRSTVELSLHRHGVEQRIREHERWLETTLRSIADAVVCADPAGRVMFLNPAAETLLATSAAAAIGRPLDDLIAEQPAAPRRGVRLGAPADHGIPVERRLKIAGREHVVSQTMSLVIEDRQILGRVMVLRDITEQRRLERRLEMADRLASLGTMAAGVAHEINNPLIAVTANLAFVREKLDELTADPAPGETAPADPAAVRRQLEGLRDAVADSQSAAHRIARVVADLKVFARPPEEQPRRADVGISLDWAIRTTAHELRQRARLVRELGTLPAVRGDEARLGQVFVNLLINAAHAIEPGAADRNLVRVSGALVGDRVVIEVHDTGVGIPDDVRPRIFEPFFTTKPVGVGTGLGLFICHSIVESMGGTLTLDSRAGAGSTFRVALPVASPSPPVAVPSVVVTPVAGARAKVLVIDDEPLVLRVVTRILERDHEVTAVESATAALEVLARRDDFDVLLCDVMMPVMTGIELYRRLEVEHPRLARRIVFLSGGAVTAEAEEFLRETASHRLDKPVGIDKLQAMVREMLVLADAG